MSDIGLIIRLWHGDRDEQEQRLKIFNKICLPTLKAQSYVNFDICPLSPPEDHARLKAMDERIKPFTLNEPYDYRRHSNFTRAQTVGLKHYPIQVRMDSDDFVSRYFMQLILDAPTHYVTFQPELYLMDEKRFKPMKHRYRDNKPSTFLAVKNYDECIYHKVFLRFNDRPCTIHPEGHAWVCIHDHNFRTNKDS
jgi:hypothetical protein